MTISFIGTNYIICLGMYSQFSQKHIIKASRKKKMILEIGIGQRNLSCIENGCLFGRPPASVGSGYIV